MADNVIVRVPEQQFIRGEDGYSPVVTVEDIEHGHRVTITDREHPVEGQSFDVMDGASAYEQAADGGYSGTEAEFNEELANFKEYAQQANYARSDAITAANTAGSYSSQARQAVNQAQSAMNGAQRAASSASESATSASGSETAAASSATAAAGSASDAATAKTRRQGSTTAAGNAQTAAEDAQEAAETAQAAAESARDAAASSATDAAGSATTATEQAQAAATARAAAETAQEAAEQAQSDAETAAQSISQSAAQITQNASDISDLKSAVNEIAVPDVVSVDRVMFLNNDQPYNGVLKSATQQTVKVCGQNILDTSVVSDGTLKNDSGTDVADPNSRYYVNMIPVIPNESLYINFGIQRIYCYDANKSWLRRTPSAHQTLVYGVYIVPADTYYIQVQFSRIDSINLNEAQINHGSVGLNYAAYSETEYTATASGVEADFPALSTVWSDGSAFDVTMNGMHPTEEFKTATVKDVADTIDSLVGIVGSASFTAEGAIVTLQSELVSRIKALVTDDAVTYYGQNIFDSSTRVSGKIKNDSGDEISDNNSSYYSRYIPVSDKTIKANFDIQRIYLYDSSKGFLSRTPEYAKGSQISFAPNVKFVQIQVRVSKITDSMCIVYGDGDTTYKAFWESAVLITRPGEDINIVGDGITSISVDVQALGVKAVIPAVKSYPMWEPTTATDAYKCTPLGQDSQSIPALTDTLGYIGFLETYFDIYLGEYSDGYSVTREDLGLDSGAEATGNIASPIYSYVFAPKNYNKTVLLSAGMNTCEASTFFGVAYFIKALMEHTEDGMDALYNSTRFVVIPVICPSGIAHDPLLYPNSNNVRINKNFEYYGSWERLKNDRGGAYPDSEIETKVLKRWLNEYAGSAFWLDCHSDTANSTIMKHLGTIFCSDSVTASRLDASRQEVINFYIDKGYITASDNTFLGFTAHSKTRAIYPKTVYGLEVTRIPSAMMEQFEYSTAWGSDGNTNNDQYAIKHYVAMIRYMVLIMCRDDQKIIFG